MGAPSNPPDTRAIARRPSAPDQHQAPARTTQSPAERDGAHVHVLRVHRLIRSCQELEIADVAAYVYATASADAWD